MTGTGLDCEKGSQNTQINLILNLEEIFIQTKNYFYQ